MQKTILFHRDYIGFTGGHLKLADYIGHVSASPQYRSELYLTPNSLSDHPWRGKVAIRASYRPETADILFIAGQDWAALADHPGIENRKPVINLIQGLRHAIPDTQLYGFLNRKATRICVSTEVANALRQTGRCNGPIHVIPNGIDLSALPIPDQAPSFDVFIAGLKQPVLAQQVRDNLLDAGLRVDCHTTPIPRSAFLRHMTNAQIALLLPREQEGFFLPALEAMTMGRVVICPDAGGNRSFCIDRQTALMPPFDRDAITTCVHDILRQPDLAARLIRNAADTSARHDLMTERRSFLDILDTVA